MTFKIVPTKTVTSYLRRMSITSKDKDRRKEINKRIEDIYEDRVNILFAFENDCGERYLAVEEENGKTHWCGDESDWEYAHSYFEDDFVNKILLTR